MTNKPSELLENEFVKALLDYCRDELLDLFNEDEKWHLQAYELEKVLKPFEEEGEE